jgi:hypothetical protein
MTSREHEQGGSRSQNMNNCYGVAGLGRLIYKLVGQSACTGIGAEQNGVHPRMSGIGDHVRLDKVAPRSA